MAVVVVVATPLRARQQESLLLVFVCREGSISNRHALDCYYYFIDCFVQEHFSPVQAQIDGH